jgi:uncharacterized OB-fold protein
MNTEISGVKCPKCQWSDFFEAQVCPRCLTELSVTSFPGQGRIVTFTVIRYPPVGFVGQAPYVVALIDLDGGPRVIGRVTARPEDVEIGVRVDFTRESAGTLEFLLARGASH